METTIKCIETHYALICPILGPFESTSTSRDCEVAMLLNPNTETLKTWDIRYGTIVMPEQKRYKDKIGKGRNNKTHQLALEEPQTA
ncbi:hypothetical protein TSAR_013286 [Trichomalopsis sarcophagae]|uniref:Uncharacterized protein n=1 Tax=Trichomalopsis sarcophagae TaxID=543379 RepID=A0A232EG99_9HYME|nr:hypothetical protein TSAR_013286 [Trichomalopsis sarcophagae]